MSACIEITAYQTTATGGPVDRDYTVSARLLTDELKQLIERQNIDCSDINCMKWPIMGMSRHATCKVLLLKSDLHNLLTFGDPSAYSGGAAYREDHQAQFRSNTQLLGLLGQNTIGEADGPYYTEYRIWFLSDPNEATYFNRMHIADIQPLMVSGFGNPEHGEALYIVTFKCFRWARRSMSFASIERPEVLPGLSLNDGQFLNFARNGTYPNSSSNTSDRSVVSFYEFACSPGMLSQFAPDIRNTVWQYKPTTVDLFAPWFILPYRTLLAARFGTPDNDLIACPFYSSDFLWDEIRRGEVTPLRLDTGRHTPYQSLLDEVLCDTTSAVHSVIPFGSASNRGQYAHTLMSLGFVNFGESNFINRVSDSIIAGTLGGNLASRSKLNDTAVKYIVPMQITAQMTPPCGIYGVPSVAPNGDPPAIFDEYKGYEHANRRPTPQSVGRWSGLDTMNKRHVTASQHGMEFGRGDHLYGNRGWGEIISDFSGGYGTFSQSAQSASFINDKDHPNRKMARRLSIRYQIASQNAADIWVRGWVMPTPSELDGWMQWIELRLQTDGKGFGFPTTRIWFDRNDPLVCPQFEDGNGKVKGLGLIKTWKGFDGKDRICLDYPFGIPCLIMVIDNERITAGVDAWRYTCVFVQKSNRPDEQIIPAVTELSDELYGGLEDIEVDDDGDPLNPQRLYSRKSVAYNLSEAANRSDFTAPGYKKPLVQPGFNVLPIGQDKDGNKRHVVVQGFIYRGGEDHRTCVYFSMPNAIDGDCP